MKPPKLEPFSPIKNFANGYDCGIADACHFMRFGALRSAHLPLAMLIKEMADEIERKLIGTFDQEAKHDDVS